MFFLDVDCGGEGILKIIKFIWILLDCVKFIVPMGLIVMVMVDFAKNVISGREDDMKKNVSIVLKRIVFALVIFLIPSIVQTAIHLLGKYEVDYAFCIDVAVNESDLSKYRTKYESGEFGDTKIVIPENLKNEKYKKKKASSGSSDTSSNNVDGTIKENIASVIAMEQGCNSEKVYLKYITTAVYINNYAYRNNGSVEITKEGLHAANKSYSSAYNDLTFDKVEPHRGTIPDEDRKRCLKIVNDILDKKFTIPKNVVLAADPDSVILNPSKITNGVVWGTDTLTGGAWPVGIGYAGTIEETDVYGNKVSTSWNETVKKAKKLSGEASTGSGRNNHTDK